MDKEKIAIVAGGGLLPQLIVNELTSRHIPFIVLEMAGSHLSTHLQSYQITPGQVKPVLDILQREQVTSIVFAGHIKRPGLLSLKVDSVGAGLLAKIMANKIHGDNSVLSIIAGFLEQHGYKVIAPNQILPSLLTPKGVLGKIHPEQIDLADINIGKEVLARLSDFDIGQAVIVENGYVLGIEAAEGTDELINRCAGIKRESGQRGVLVKMKKTNQDKRLDLPTIGLVTIEKAILTNLKVVAVEAGASFIIKSAEALALADKNNIVVMGV